MAFWLIAATLLAVPGEPPLDAAALARRIDQRLAFVDAPPDLGHDALDNRFGHFIGNEPPPR